MMTNEQLIDFITPLFTAIYRVPAENERPNIEPLEFYCETFCKYIYKHAFNRDVFLIAAPVTGNGFKTSELVRFIKNHPERILWPISATPIHGGLVEMSYETHPHHVGVWLDIDGGGVLHCYTGGVAFATLLELKTSGWRRFVFHGWHED
jgi:hypothetical protein